MLSRLSKQRQLPTRPKNSSSTKKVVKVKYYHKMADPRRSKATATTVSYHTLEPNEAKTKVQEYINKYPGARTSKIIESLKINPIQVSDILDELEEEHSIYSREIGEGPK